MNDDEMTKAQVEYFEYLDGLVAEMGRLFQEHEELVEEYDLGMQHLNRMGWRQGYVQRHATGYSVEGQADGDSVD